MKSKQTAIDRHTRTTYRQHARKQWKKVYNIFFGKKIGEIDAD
jgi:hypothetical protein